MYEYKILTERDSAFAGKFDLVGLETALNSYAAEGWRVAEGFHVGLNLMKFGKAEIVVILEREQGTPGPATDRTA